MNIHKFYLLICLTSFISLNIFAADKFQIPKERHKDLVGSWKVIKMGKIGGKLQDIPNGREMLLTFQADGSGTQLKRKQVKDIVWGANKDGLFTMQWKQENGNGDGVMGAWIVIKGGIRLELTEYEDSKIPEDKFVMIIKSIVDEKKK